MKSKPGKLILENPELGKPQKWDDFIKLLVASDSSQFQIYAPTESGGKKRVSVKKAIEEIRKMSKP
jgi:hypothetical protein